MSSTNIFSKKNILKLILIILSVFFWLFFYVSSNVNLDSIIIFNISTIINTYFSTNFLIFLIFFPITTGIVISLALTNKNIKENILITTIALFVASFFSFFIFRLSTLFLLFSFFYIILHIIVLYIIKTKLDSEKKKSIINIASFCGSKVALFLTIILFIIIVVYIYPNQQTHAKRMEAGVVELFIGDDLSNWFGTSYSINTTCTKQNLEYIMEDPSFQRIEDNASDEDVINFINFMKNYENKVNSKKTDKEVEESFPDLSAIEIKENVLETIRDIPLMVIVEEYFAIVFAFIIVSFVYLYFGIAFGMLGILFVYLFYLLFKNNKNKNLEDKGSSNNFVNYKENKKKDKSLNKKNKEDKEESENKEDLDSFDFSQKKGSKPPI